MMTPQEIKNQLRSMYQGYQFEVKSDTKSLLYIILVFKDRKQLSTLDMPTNTPLDQFWGTVKEWMRHVMSGKVMATR